MNGFTVEAVQRQDRLRPDGGTNQVYVAWLETKLGAQGRVVVSAEKWESDDLQEILQEEANKLDKAFHLADPG